MSRRRAVDPALLLAATERCERAVYRLGGWIEAGNRLQLPPETIRRRSRSGTLPCRLGWAATLERIASRQGSVPSP